MPTVPYKTPIRRLLKRYLDEAIQGESKKYDRENTDAKERKDREAIAAANGTAKNRVDKIRSFLSYYGVLQNLRKLEEDIAKAVISFFNKPNIKTRTIGGKTREKDCIELFSELSRHLYDEIPALKIQNGGMGRKLTSLLTKALWCRFPEHIPIYDRNAFVAINSLFALSMAGQFKKGEKPIRPSCDDQTEIDKRDYQIFIKSYFTLYELADQSIKAAIKAKKAKSKKEPYPKYPIRVFDRMLWHFRSRSVDIPHKKEVVDAWRNEIKTS